MFLKCIGLVAFFACRCQSLAKLDEVFKWKELSFVWPSDDAREAAIREGTYVPANNLPLGMERWKDRLFITIPRWKNGVPTSLGYISLNEANSTSPAIIPYPDWSANALPKDDARPQDGNFIISTFRLAVDACDRLWVMDVGWIEPLKNRRTISPPAIVIYDLKTDKFIKRYTLKPEVLKTRPFFGNIVVDVNKDKCDDAYAYLPDISDNGLVVYSLKNDDSWRFEHPFFHNEPSCGNLTVGGVKVEWTDGIFGLALGPEDDLGYRTMYFHALAGLNEYSINTKALKNRTLTHDSVVYFIPKREGFKGEDTQATTMVFDQPSNTLFFDQLVRDGVACWNPRKPLKPENVAMVAQDHENLIFTNEIRIDDDRNLWMLSNQMPKFLFEELNADDINYRIFKVKVDDAIAGTPCAALSDM